MSKFVLFLGLIFLGCIVFSGAVSAAAGTGGVSVNSVSSHKLAHIEILGQVKKCSDGTPFEGATVTVKENGTRITSTTTKTDGTYTLKFQSKSRLFTVIASANGHKPSAQKVSVNRNTQGKYTGKANFQLGANDAYVWNGWTSNPALYITFSDLTTINYSATNAFTNILQGTNYATENPGVNTVYIYPSTYNEQNIGIGSSVNIHGEDQATTIIDANSLGRVFVINSGTVTITNVTITNGASTGAGGAIDNGGICTVTGCAFNSNTATGFGGAIYNSIGNTLTVRGSTFHDNTADTNGGAIYNYYGTLTVTDNTFNGNTATFSGGAIYNQFSGTCTVTDCSFTGNSATSNNGGAIYNGEGVLTVTGCAFNSNTAYIGGAIYNDLSGTLSVTGSNIFTGNTATATSGGGAIYNDGILTVTGSNFTGNSATSGSGGAILNYHGGTSLTPVIISGNTFNSNSATNSGGAIYNGVGVLTVTGSNIFTGNTASYGGAIINNNDLTVTCSTFNSNIASYGGAIYNNAGTANVHFNRIVGNTATTLGSAIYRNSGTVDAKFNWWGFNTGPSTGDVFGTVTVTPYLVLRVTANPITIPNGGHSIITVDLTHDNSGNHQTVGYVPDGIPVSFITTLGTMGTPFSMVNGVSHATLYSGTVSGLAYVIAIIDNQPVITQVTIDTIPPVVSFVDPVNNMKINVVNKVITVTFSEPILAGSAYNSISVTVPSGTFTMTKHINGNILTLTPIVNYTDGNYIVNIPVNSITDLAGNNLATAFSSSFTIDTIPPIVGANPTGGLYKTNKIINLSMNEPGTIYYTLNGSTPTKTSTKYTGSIIMSSTKTLKFLAIDTAGNKSPIYTKIYTIDKIAPKIATTTPSNLKTGVNRFSTIIIKFNENIKASNFYYKITIKNITTGKYSTLTKTITGNTLYIKTTSPKIAKTWYTVTIPKAAIKDYAGNNLAAIYTFKFKTGV